MGEHRFTVHLQKGGSITIKTYGDKAFLSGWDAELESSFEHELTPADARVLGQRLVSFADTAPPAGA